MARVLIVAPPELIAGKVISYYRCQGKPKAGTDWRDIAMLLLTFPELKSETGPVAERLLSLETDPAVLKIWKEFVTGDIQAADEDDEFE